MRTPIRYAGGKSKAFDFISTYIPFWPRPKEIVSPFFGGGSFEFYMQNKYQLNILANDKFTHLMKTGSKDHIINV